MIGSITQKLTKKHISYTLYLCTLKNGSIGLRWILYERRFADLAAFEGRVVSIAMVLQSISFIGNDV